MRWTPPTPPVLRLLLIGATILVLLAHALARQEAPNTGRAGGRAGQESRAGGDGDDGEGDLRTTRWKVALPPGELAIAPATLLLSEDHLWRTAPVLWEDREGRPWLACQEYVLGQGDFLRIRPLLGNAEGATGVTEPPEEVPGGPRRLVQPTAALGPGGMPCLFWVEVGEEAARLCFSRREAAGWTPGQELETSSRPAYHPSAAFHDGALYLAWQAWQDSEEGGGFDVHVARLEGDRLVQETRLTADRASDWQPALASSPTGSLWLAWTRYRGRDHEILLQELDRNLDRVGAPISVSRNPTADDLHPALACGPEGEVWVAWDSIDDPRRGVSSRGAEVEQVRGSEASLRIACVREGRVESPSGDNGEGPGVIASALLLSWSGGSPALFVDAHGAPTVCYRSLSLHDTTTQHSYPVVTQTCRGEAWTAPRMIQGSDGSQDRPAVMVGASGAWVAAQQDGRRQLRRTRLGRRPDEDTSEALAGQQWYLNGVLGPSGVTVARLPLDQEQGPPPVTEALDSPPQATRPHPLGDPEHDPILKGSEHFRVQDGDREYVVLWGDLHRHSSVSRCLDGIEPGPDDRYVFGRDVTLNDFFALTDHSGHTDPFQWWELVKRVDLYQTPRFTTLVGFEWSSGFYGHQNVIFRDRDDRVVSSSHPQGRTPNQLWDLLEEGRALTIPHHSAAARMATDWRYTRPEFLRLVEVYQSARGSFEFDGCFGQARAATERGHFVQDALEMGVEFGLVAATDHGNEASYAAVLAEGTDRAAVFDALYARRTYGATTKGLFLDFRVDGVLMGGTVQSDGAPRLTLSARGTQDLADVRVFRNGEALFHAGGRSPRERTTELAIRWYNEPEDEGPWRFELTAHQGSLTPAEGAMKALGPRRIEITQDGGAGSKAPVRTMTFRGPRNAPFTFTVEHWGITTQQTNLRELKARALASVDALVRWELSVVTPPERVSLDKDLGRREFEGEWVDDDCPPEGAWYYARIIQKDGEMAWSSPVFVRRP